MNHILLWIWWFSCSRLRLFPVQIPKTMSTLRQKGVVRSLAATSAFAVASSQAHPTWRLAFCEDCVVWSHGCHHLAWNAFFFLKEDSQRRISTAPVERLFLYHQQHHDRAYNHNHQLHHPTILIMAVLSTKMTVFHIMSIWWLVVWLLPSVQQAHITRWDGKNGCCPHHVSAFYPSEEKDSIIVESRSLSSWRLDIQRQPYFSVRTSVVVDRTDPYELNQ